MEDKIIHLALSLKIARLFVKLIITKCKIYIADRCPVNPSVTVLKEPEIYFPFFLTVLSNLVFIKISCEPGKK